MRSNIFCEFYHLCTVKKISVGVQQTCCQLGFIQGQQAQVYVQEPPCIFTELHLCSFTTNLLSIRFHTWTTNTCLCTGCPNSGTGPTLYFYVTAQYFTRYDMYTYRNPCLHTGQVVLQPPQSVYSRFSSAFIQQNFSFIGVHPVSALWDRPTYEVLSANLWFGFLTGYIY